MDEMKMGDRILLTDGELEVLCVAETTCRRARYAITIAIMEAQAAETAFWDRVRELRPDVAREWEFVWNSDKRELRLSHRKKESHHA